MLQLVLTLLEQMQQEMERLDLWQTTPPSAAQFQSDVPFCMNTLSCAQWLQWVYIARLRALIDANGTLPNGAHVLPYAQESFKVEGVQSTVLLELIAQLDNLLA